jgi:anthranilate phosphoribosyltransferase
MTITQAQALTRCIEHREIFHDEMLQLVRAMMQGEMTAPSMAALLMGLRVKKETVGEIAAAAQVMREFATPVAVEHKEHLVDLCGTGGDGAHTFNISTASMFVAAAAGARVAKHGNRGLSSSSGSAVAAVRRELGVRTIFNILGPLTNPAGAPNQLMGVFHPDLVGIQVRVLERLGSEHVLVVYGKDGMDEASLGAGTMVGELKDGVVTEYEIHPEDFGMSMVSNRTLKVSDAKESAALVIAALENHVGAPREIVVLNAGLALYAADVADSIGNALGLARDAIESGAARAKLDQFVTATQKLASPAGH